MSERLVQLWRPCEQVPVTGWASEPVIPLWRDLELEVTRLVGELERQKSDLESRKDDLLARRLNLTALRERLDHAHAALDEGRNIDAASKLTALLRDLDKLEDLRDRQELAAAKLYLLQDRGLTDQMLQVAGRALDGVPFDEEHLRLYYDVAVLHQEAGDPAVARLIFQRFVDGTFFDFEDVTERIKRA